MRVNVYAEELTDRIEIISKEIDGHRFTGLRFYLELPVTVGTHPPTEPVRAPENPGQENPPSSLTHRSVDGTPEVFPPTNGKAAQVQGPFMHRPGDDDSAAVTFWGKRDFRALLRKALAMLDAHYGEPVDADEAAEQLASRRWNSVRHCAIEIADHVAWKAPEIMANAVAESLWLLAQTLQLDVHAFRSEAQQIGREALQPGSGFTDSSIVEQRLVRALATVGVVVG